MIKKRYSNTITLQKTDVIFDKEMKEIIGERYANGLDKKLIGRAVVQRKITKHPFWINIKNDLKHIKFLPEDNAGQLSGTFSIFTIIIVIFLATIFFGGWIYITGLINTQLNNVGLLNEVNAGRPGYTNMTLAASATIGQVNIAIQSLRLVALTFAFSLILSAVLIGFLSKKHPVFFFLHVLVTLLAVFLAVPISNAYETLLKANTFNGTLSSFTGTNWLLLNLPLVTAITGSLGAIFIFVNILRSDNEEVYL